MIGMTCLEVSICAANAYTQDGTRQYNAAYRARQGSTSMLCLRVNLTSLLTPVALRWCSIPIVLATTPIQHLENWLLPLGDRKLQEL